MELSWMNTFVKCVELGSLAAAAKELKISSAAVSKQLSRLEGELKTDLLIRTTRRLELTEKGGQYFQSARQILEEIKEANDLAREKKEKPQGVLKIVSARQFALSNLLPHLKEFLSVYPEIEIDLELAERIPDLDTENVDVVIGMSFSMSEASIQRKIGKTKYLLAASPAYLQKFGTPLTPKDLTHHRYLGHSKREPVDVLSFQKESVKVKPYLLVNDTESLLKLAIDGLGIVMLHDYALKEAFSKNELLPLLESHLTVEAPLYVAIKNKRFQPAKVRCFLDFMLKKLSF